jgi:hypothetical protein
MDINIIQAQEQIANVVEDCALERRMKREEGVGEYI